MLSYHKLGLVSMSDIVDPIHLGLLLFGDDTRFATAFLGRGFRFGATVLRIAFAEFFFGAEAVLFPDWYVAHSGVLLC